MTSSRAFVASTIVLAIAAVVSQAINFVGMLVVARLYGPSEVGMFGLFGVVFTFAAFAASWRYELAIVTVSEEIEAEDVAIFVVSAGLASALVSLAALVGLSLLPTRPSISDQFLAALWWLPLSLVFTGLTLAGSSWSMRHSHVGLLALQQMAQPLVATMMQVLFARIGFGSGGGGLVAGFVIGQVVSASIVAIPLCLPLVRACWRPHLASRLLVVTRLHRAHFLYTIPYSLLTQLYYQAPMIVLGVLFGPRDVGFFSLAFRTTSTPISVVPHAAAQMFFPGMARDRDRLDIWEPKLGALLVALGFVLAPVAAALIVAGPDLFAAMFGAPWRTAGLFVQILIVSTLLNGLVSGYDRIYFVLGRQKTALKITAAVALLSAFLMLTFETIFETSTAVVAAWSLAHVVLAIAWTSTAYRLAGFSLFGLFRVWAAVLGTIGLVAVIIVLARSWLGYDWRFAVFAAVFGALYAAFCLWHMRPTLSALRR